MLLAPLLWGERARADEPAPASSANATSKARPSTDDDSTTRVTSEVSAYTDSDHVTIFTPSIGASIENVTTGASLHGRYLVDVVSAASVDVVTTASRAFKEVRQAGTLSADYKPHDFGLSIAGSISREPDYLSTGGSLSLTKDFDEKNTTLNGGFGYSRDVAGRSGTPFAIFSRELQRSSFTAGLTQVVDRASVFSLSLDVVLERGDQSKPYRYVPMFSADNAAAAARGASNAWVTAHREAERPLEQLPLSRRRVALSARYQHRFAEMGSTLRLDERVYADTWGLLATSTEGRWLFDAGRRFTLWPHVRFHAQNSTSFWKRAYVTGAAPSFNLPELRTGDRELGALHTITAGGGIKWSIGPAADPHAMGIAFHGDAIYTTYSDALYLSNRTGVLGALTFEGEL